MTAETHEQARIEAAGKAIADYVGEDRFGYDPHAACALAVADRFDASHGIVRVPTGPDSPGWDTAVEAAEQAVRDEIRSAREIEPATLAARVLAALAGLGEQP